MDRAQAEWSRCRRRHLIGALLGAALENLLAPGEVFAKVPPSPFRVIVHPQNPATVLSIELVADMFLKKATRWDDDESVHPFDQGPNSEVRKQFSDVVLQRSVAAVRHYWQQRIFSGRGVPPPELESDEAVLRRVQTDRQAIGYVSARAALTAVNVVTLH
jgi:ABC-type phosphate transport system substrate-binding protein